MDILKYSDNRLNKVGVLHNSLMLCVCLTLSLHTLTPLTLTPHTLTPLTLMHNLSHLHMCITFAHNVTFLLLDSPATFCWGLCVCGDWPLLSFVQFTDSFHTAAVLDALAAFVTPTVSVMAT